jgi:hypothetical protein
MTRMQSRRYVCVRGGRAHMSVEFVADISRDTCVSAHLFHVLSWFANHTHFRAWSVFPSLS